MLAVSFLAGDLRRNDAGGPQHLGPQRPLQMLTQIARLSREERRPPSPLRGREVSEKGKVFIGQPNHDRAHGLTIPRPRTAAKLVLECVRSYTFRRSGAA